MYVFPGVFKYFFHSASTQRGLLQLMVYQPIAIDYALTTPLVLRRSRLYMFSAQWI